MLRRIQAGAALLWVIYGVAIDAAPVIVANLIVAAAALYSSFAQRRPEGPGRSVTAPAGAVPTPDGQPCRPGSIPGCASPS